MIRKVVALDTSVIIHHANDDPKYGDAATKWLNLIISGQIKGIASVVVITEFLSFRLKGGRARAKRQVDINKLLSWLLAIPNLKMIDISGKAAVDAARLRRLYNFKTPDALHLACAVEAGANVFVTSDKKLQKCKEIKVKLL